jgi:2-dehydro-3-deoxygluconokinase
MATVYSDRGLGVRAPVVFYNRANEAAARLAPGDFDWDAIFAGGVRWFHSGGIFASLSQTTGPLIVEAMQAAAEAGAVASFDLNYREKLWNQWGGSEKARSILREIVSHADVLVRRRRIRPDRALTIIIQPTTLSRGIGISPIVEV